MNHRSHRKLAGPVKTSSRLEGLGPKPFLGLSPERVTLWYGLRARLKILNHPPKRKVTLPEFLNYILRVVPATYY